MCKPSPGKIIGIGFFVIFAIIAIGFITMQLWNWLIPTLFSGPVITYWQAIGLLVLSKILFSGGHSSKRHHRSSHHHPWKSQLRKKMEDHHRVPLEMDDKTTTPNNQND